MDILDIDNFTHHMIMQALPIFYEGLCQIQIIMNQEKLQTYSFHAGAFHNSKSGAHYKRAYHCTFQSHHFNKNKEFKKVIFQLDSFEEFIGRAFKPAHTLLDQVGQSKEFTIKKETNILDLLNEVLSEEYFIHVEHYVMNKHNINENDIHNKNINDDAKVNKIKI